MDFPIFLEVAQVNMGYSVSGQVNVTGADIGSENYTNPWFKVGGNASYSDRPNITYRPIKGKEFTKSFMTPIPVSVVMFLMQNGWPVDLIMPLTVDSINGLRSEISGGQISDWEIPNFMT
jgi:hypothetical protein